MKNFGLELTLVLMKIRTFCKRNQILIEGCLRIYETKDAGRYDRIHGSLEASTNLRMLGLEPFRPDLIDHKDMVETIESAVEKFTIQELEELNARLKQVRAKALEYDNFVKIPHGCCARFISENIDTTQGQAIVENPPWSITSLESKTLSIPLPCSPAGSARVLKGIKILDLTRIIAGPTISCILGADVLKATGPNISDVPYFQVDGNMGKHATELDLK